MSDVFTHVGYLVETATAYPNLTVRENLDIQRRLTGAPRAAVTEAIDLMRLDAHADRRAGALSLGLKQRLALAWALLHRPELLILDEPANGLDPAGIVEIRELLQSLTTEHGVTVFMSSHILAEVAHLADRIGIVDAGHLIEELDREELHARERGHVRVGASEPQRVAALLAAAGFAHVEPADGHLRVFDAQDRVPEEGRAVQNFGQKRLGPRAASATSTALASVLRAKSRAVVVASHFTAAAALVTSRSNAAAAAAAASAAWVAAEATAVATAAAARAVSSAVAIAAASTVAASCRAMRAPSSSLPEAIDAETMSAALDAAVATRMARASARVCMPLAVWAAVSAMLRAAQAAAPAFTSRACEAASAVMRAAATTDFLVAAADLATYFASRAAAMSACAPATNALVSARTEAADDGSRELTSEAPRINAIRKASSPEPCLALRLISVANALACIGVMVSTTFAGELSPRPDELVVPSVPMPVLLHRCQPSPFPDYADDTTQHVGLTHSRASSGETSPPACGSVIGTVDGRQNKQSD